MAPLLLRRLAFSLLFCAVTALAAADDDPFWRAPLIEKLTGELKEIDHKLTDKPDTVAYLSRRGDLYLFLGAYPESSKDFERMITLDSNQDAQHWRLGIAYYFNGQFEKAERQFVKYHGYDPKDRENGIWKFLAQEKVDGLKTAREEMLTYPETDREPFIPLYEMYAGKRSPEDVLAYIADKKFAADKHVQFFGNYYAGLYELMLDHREHALQLLRKAVDVLPADPDTVYMWNVARLSWERLLKEEKKRQ
jgi:lipoprotein NlpI